MEVTWRDIEATIVVEVEGGRRIYDEFVGEYAAFVAWLGELGASSDRFVGRDHGRVARARLLVKNRWGPTSDEWSVGETDEVMRWLTDLPAWAEASPSLLRARLRALPVRGDLEAGDR